MDISSLLQNVDWNGLLYASGAIIMFYKTNHILKRCVLRKDFNVKEMSNVSLPPELTKKYTDVNILKITSMKFNEQILNFVSVIKNEFPSYDLTNFYNNINDLRIKYEVFANDFSSYGRKVANYSTKLNTIKSCNANSVYHELFHMASSVYKDGISYSGFRQFHKNFKLGTVMNEGYTELLTQRYFGNEKGYNSYIFEVNIMKYIEENIGKEKMSSLYLNSNLLGLISELKKYATEDEIMTFISRFDFLGSYMYDKKLTMNDRKMVNSAIKDVYHFIFKFWIGKLGIAFNYGSDVFELYKKEYITRLKYDLDEVNLYTDYIDTRELVRDFESLVYQNFMNDKRRIA